MNQYEKKARLYPAIAGMAVPAILTYLLSLPLIPGTWKLWTEFFTHISPIIPIALVFGSVGYLAIQLFIGTSKILFQYSIFKEDETKMPTTELISWTSTNRKSEEDIKQIAKKVKKDFGITLKNKEQELEDPIEAKKIIVDAVGKIREKTRNNGNLLQYNIKYGFCRNYLGASVYSIVYIIIAIILNHCLHLWTYNIIIIALIIQLILAILVFFIMKMNAKDYARSLYNAYMSGTEYKR